MLTNRLLYNIIIIQTKQMEKTMMEIINIYFGGIKNRGGVFAWEYGSIEVKETPKQYQVTEDIDWCSAHKGMIIKKEYFDGFGNTMMEKGQFLLVDDETLAKQLIKEQLEEELGSMQNLYEYSVSAGRNGNRHKRIANELKQMLRVVK